MKHISYAYLVVSLLLGFAGGVMWNSRIMRSGEPTNSLVEHAYRPDRPKLEFMDKEMFRERLLAVSKTHVPEETEMAVGFRASFSTFYPPSYPPNNTLSWQDFLDVKNFVASGAWKNGWDYEGTEGIIVWHLVPGFELVGVRWTKERKPIAFSGELSLR